MSARGKARKRALDILFASEMRDEGPDVALERAIADGEGPSNDYTVTLVRGVVEHRSEIDRLVSEASREWSLERMPAVDRNVLRLGVFEVLHVEDVPNAVAVSEAMNLVRELSTDESPSFVNGILGAIVRQQTSS